MKKETYNISAFCPRQLAFLAFTDHLKIYKYLEKDANGVPYGYAEPSPFTGKYLCIHWKVESCKLVKEILMMILAMLFDSDGIRNRDELLRIGYMRYEKST